MISFCWICVKYLIKFSSLLVKDLILKYKSETGPVVLKYGMSQNDP